MSSTHTTRILALYEAHTISTTTVVRQECTVRCSCGELLSGQLRGSMTAEDIFARHIDHVVAEEQLRALDYPWISGDPAAEITIPIPIVA